MRILHLEKDCYPVEALERLENIANVDYFDTDSQLELMNFIHGKSYNILFTKLGLAIDEYFINAVPSLSVIVTPTTGLNHISTISTDERKIDIISLRHEQAFLQEITSTAEHTWALLLSLLRKIPEAREDVLLGNWRRVPFLASELYKKTLGIIGYGRLGKIVARYGAAFGMKVLAYDIDPSAFHNQDSVSQANLSTLLSKSDIISLHIPANEANYQFLDKPKLLQTKKGCIIINTSRGEVVNEQDLLHFLSNGHLAGAATDVLEGDSTWGSVIPDNNQLLHYARNNINLLITPHMGGYGTDAILRTRSFITDKFIKFIKEYEKL